MKHLVAASAILVAIVSGNPVQAHGGGLNAEGCHNNRKTGDYHCHRGAPAKRPAPIKKPAARPKPVVNYPAPRVAVPVPLIKRVIAAPLPLAGVGSAITAQSAQVVDGDTLIINGTRIRLFGVDAFEGEQSCTRPDGSSWTCGGSATRALSRLVAMGPVSCAQQATDQYGRPVAVCTVEGTDLGRQIVAMGLAVAYRNYSEDYVPVEDEAKLLGMGAWDGSFIMPQDFRRSSEEPTAAVAVRETGPQVKVDDCKIKGNVNLKGERIYHMPGQMFYGRTAAEAYFCSAAEAERAGYRAAKR